MANAPSTCSLPRNCVLERLQACSSANWVLQRLQACISAKSIKNPDVLLCRRAQPGDKLVESWRDVVGKVEGRRWKGGMDFFLNYDSLKAHELCAEQDERKHRILSFAADMLVLSKAIAFKRYRKMVWLWRSSLMQWNWEQCLETLKSLEICRFSKESNGSRRLWRV